MRAWVAHRRAPAAPRRLRRRCRRLAAACPVRLVGDICHKQPMVSIGTGGEAAVAAETTSGSMALLYFDTSASRVPPSRYGASLTCFAQPSLWLPGTISMQPFCCRTGDRGGDVGGKVGKAHIQMATLHNDDLCNCFWVERSGRKRGWRRWRVRWWRRWGLMAEPPRFVRPSNGLAVRA